MMEGTKPAGVVPVDALAAAETLLQARRVLLTTHLNADGDGGGCQAALAGWLRLHGIDVLILNPTPYPDWLRSLLPDPGILLDPASPAAAEAAAAAELAVVVDTGEVSRIGRVRPLIRDLPTLVIDHHPIGDDPILGLSHRDSSAAAAAELVWRVIRAKEEAPLPRGIVEPLYVGIFTDTGGFRFSNTTAETFRVAAELVEAGVLPEEMHRRIHGSVPLRKWSLLKGALETLTVEDGVGSIEVSAELFAAHQATSEDLEDFVDYPRGVEGVEIALLLRELPEGGTKISFRSTGEADVNALARTFGGGGHVRASGARLDEPFPMAREAVLRAAREAVAALREGEKGGDDAPG